MRTLQALVAQCEKEGLAEIPVATLKAELAKQEAGG